MLASTRGYLCSLQAQVSELSRRNRELEAQVRRRKNTEPATGNVADNCSPPPPPPLGARLDVRVMNLVESAAAAAAEERSLSLRVSVRGERSLLDLATRVLEFLKRVKNVRVVSIEAESTQVPETPSLMTNVLIMRLTVEVRI